VCDVAEGHSLSFKLLEKNVGLKIFNLGTGKGYSVFQMINEFEKVSGKKVEYLFFMEKIWIKI
jgi:UDP-glucose 4-epimerase